MKLKNYDSAFKDMGPPMTQKYIFCLWQGLKKPPALKSGGGQNILQLLGLEKERNQWKTLKKKREKDIDLSKIRMWNCHSKKVALKIPMSKGRGGP